MEDNDLKIVLSTELEADEKASAQRISAQLPNISKLINSKSNIKVGVSLDDSNIQTQAQRISAKIPKAANVDVGLNLHVTKDAKQMLKDALGNIGDGGVNASITAALTKDLDNMEVKVKNIHAEWVKIGKTKERLLQLSVSGTTKDLQDITILQQYDESGRKVLETTKSLSLNLEKIEQQEKRDVAQAKKDNDSRIASLINLEAQLDSIKAKYSDINAPSAINNQDSLDALNSKYQKIADTIAKLRGTDGKLSPVDVADIKKQISALENLVTAYQHLESAGTKLRKKDVEAIKVDQNAGLNKLEEQLKNTGILTDEFHDKISELRTELSNVSDAGGIRSFLDWFDALRADASVLQEKIRGINSTFKELAEVEKEIVSVQNQMNDGDELSASYAKLSEKLELLNAQKAVLEQQINNNKELIQYSSQAARYEMTRLDLQIKTAQAEEEVANAAKEIDGSMSGMEAVVQNIEARFRSLSDAPVELTQKVGSLKSLLADVSDASTDKAKIEAYQQLKDAISGCNKEITQLMGVQRKDIQDFRFSENLEKTKADLTAIGRQWSALFSDEGLNASFKQLQAKLEGINNQADLSKWTAEFNRFKSEVKAAGKNVQSFKDIFKNNISKVAQWGLATISIYDVVNRLKSAVNTVVELDTAMIDLRKTTDETDAAYKRFYVLANETAKKLGVTTEAIISQTAEWTRLGMSLKDAATMANNSAIFKAISPEMDISTATNGLISVIKAFKLEADEVLDGVISKINKIGNELPVSNLDIVEVLTRSSAAMSAANNSLEQTIALATAGVAITRDAEGMGQALKTLSMRIRGYSEETEEYSEDIAALTGKIADLTKVASNGNRGISLFEAGNPEQYRSTYDILKDIADIWDELTDKNQAQLLEALFGKQRGQTGAAILSNFADAESAMEKMANSAGNAMQEMEKVYDSLEYKLNRLQETWTGVAQSLLDSDDLKFGVDSINFMSEAIAELIDILGPLGTALAGVGIVEFIKNLD